MKISIITVVYNNQKEISHAIDSVLSQDYQNIEYIIVDGASTDGTKEIIEPVVPRISMFLSEPDKGMYDALNKGISLASGDVIGILHSDDILENNSIISEIAKVFEKTAADGVYGDLVYVTKDNPDKIIRYWKSKPFTTPLLKKGWMPPHPTLFLRKSVFEKCGLYDISFKIAADYDFMLRVLSQPGLKFEYLPKKITRMRVGGTSNRSIKNIIRKSKDDLRALRKNHIGGYYALFIKNFSKIDQFFKRK